MTMSNAAQPDADTLSAEANGLLQRAVAAGDLAGIDAALQRYATVVAITPPGHQHLGIRLNNLGYGYFLRYLRSGADEDAWHAVQAGEQGAAVVRPGDPNTAIILSNLAATYLTRVQRAAQPGDLDRAIQLSELALRSPGAEPFVPACLTNLVTGYLLRFEETGQLEDVHRAVDIGRQAVNATVPGSAGRATLLNNVATAHRDRYN